MNAGAVVTRAATAHADPPGTVPGVNINAASALVGIPALTVRSLLRRSRYGISATSVATTLKLSAERSLQVLDALTDAGLVGAGEWADDLTLTSAGHGYANAAVGTVTRSTATRALAGLLERAREVNADSDTIYKVAEIVVFGSFLDPSRDRLGDLDVAIPLVRVRETAYWVGGDIFGERVSVLRKLKNRSRTISIVDLDDHRSWLADKAHESVFTDDTVRRTNHVSMAVLV